MISHVQIWGYCRVSSDLAEQTESLEAQQAWAQQHAISLGLSARLFVERLSGKDIVGRPVLTGMLAESERLSKDGRPFRVALAAFDRSPATRPMRSRPRVG
jgi:DNA invertase Pin-like site-specific DNA recombinase